MPDDSSRSVPISDLDYNSQLTNPMWGDGGVSAEVKDNTKETDFIYDSQGKPLLDPDTQKPYIRERVLWSGLGIFTRDLRLGNLSEQNNELLLVRYMQQLAYDLFQAGMKHSYATAQGEVATVLETSQSKNGFLRVKMNTLRHENLSQNLEPPKKSFFGGGNKQQGGF